jgi:hypothetical protein
MPPIALLRPFFSAPQDTSASVRVGVIPEILSIAGLLSHVSGKVPVPGDKVDLEGYCFKVPEASQRKVPRLRARHLPATARSTPR